jgi:hypothetical protein
LDDGSGTLVAAATAQESPARRTPRQPGAGGGNPKRVAVVVVAIVVMAGLGILVANLVNNMSNGQKGAGSSSSSQQASAQAPPSTTTGGSTPSAVSGQPTPPDLSGGSLDFSAAGERVIAYYNGLPNLHGMWTMLTPNAQAVFGSEQDFTQYWSQYKQVSARNAYGVTTNADGSVTVPVDVTYDGAKQKRTVRVTRLGGEYYIDSDAK